MGDNAEHRHGPQSGSSGGRQRGGQRPLTETDVKASRAESNGRKPD